MRKLFFHTSPIPGPDAVYGGGGCPIAKRLFSRYNHKNEVDHPAEDPFAPFGARPAAMGVTRDHACRKRGLPVKNDKIHSSLLTLVGGYLLYIAYHLLENMRKGSADMSRAMFTVLIAAFAGMGIGVLFYAWKIWRRSKADEGDDRPEDRDPR